MDAPEAVSYRQVGKRAGGRVKRGFIAGQGGAVPKQASSIPSKFETTLFTGNKERDGFGTRSHRFVETENELPGPGSYEQDGKLVDTKIYSKKGLGGGFASKTVRASAFGKTSTTPAPGAYEISRRFTEPPRPGDANTSAFKPPTQRSVTVAEDPLPGPGQYQVKREFVKTHGGRQSAETGEGFSSSAARFSRMAADAMPAPGQYNPAPPGHSHAHSDDALPSAAFRSGVPSRSQGTSASRMTKEQQLGVVGYKGEAAPGPGAYNSARTAFAISHRRSPQFCDSALDRWGQPVLRRTTAPSTTPGPGTYHREPARETAPISSSAFMSGSSQTQNPARAAIPGPAYYTPSDQLSKQRSYHLNAVQRWMPG